MKKTPSLIEQYKQGIKDVKLYKQGKLTFKSYKINLPKEDFPPDDIKRIREEELHVSQKILAESPGVSVRTLQGWEIGRSKPIGPDLKDWTVSMGAVSSAVDVELESRRKLEETGR
jgi:DNA-binding transcriptional regulator YiaG